MTAAHADASEPKQVVEVDTEDLPVYCPGPKAPLWSMHPRVFLDISHTGRTQCPYCGAEYRLKPGASVGHGH
jgi:uncharacterized Zn-finger protein